MKTITQKMNSTANSIGLQRLSLPFTESCLKLPNLPTTSLPNKPTEIAIIGGGRWAKIIAKVLNKLHLNFTKIHMVSPRNYQALKEWIKECSESSDEFKIPINVTQQIEDILHNKNVTLAYVANLPQDHYETASLLIKHKKHLIVEKPFVANVIQAQHLIQMARQQGCKLMVGYEYMLASYLYHFKDLMSEKIFRVKEVKICWEDQYLEEKWGTTKKPDLTTNVLEDIFPHILAILTTLFGIHRVENLSLEMYDGGNATCLSFDYNDIPVFVNLSRVANSTQRSIVVKSYKEEELSLNFSQEPGDVFWNGASLASITNWNHIPKPLEASILLFLSSIEYEYPNYPLDGENSIHILESMQIASREMHKKQTELIYSFLKLSYPCEVPHSVIVALMNQILPSFLIQHLVNNPKDEKNIITWTKVAFQIIHRLSVNPFTIQEDILKEHQISKEDLIKLNTILRHSEWVQNLITSSGLGAKYWNNTIIPIAKSGHLEMALEKKYIYPHRVGIYPGVSCMFFCTFCGRNPEAKYAYDVIHSGNEYFKSLFKKSPKDDPYRFYISGGLEPLTNPEIGELVAYGANEGFKLSLYTNAFMLTPQLLEKKPGLWEADSIRVSLYGVNPQTGFEITQNKNSFTQVIKNVKSFLKMRNEKKSLLKLGFNFVILPNKQEEILQMAEVLAEINREAGQDGQINFLTLREDYSVQPEMGISYREKENLVQIFHQLEQRLQKEDLCDLQVDYGYSLYAHKQGNPNYQMEMVNAFEMRKEGYPQISLVTDLLQDIYMYREAGFLNREGADRYILGRVNPERSFETIIKNFIEQKCGIEPMKNDTDYFDIFDHIITKILNKLESDKKFGIPVDKGPVSSLIPNQTLFCSNN